jgi:hypothetical protein
MVLSLGALSMLGKAMSKVIRISEMDIERLILISESPGCHSRSQVNPRSLRRPLPPVFAGTVASLLRPSFVRSVGRTLRRPRLH